MRMWARLVSGIAVAWMAPLAAQTPPSNPPLATGTAASGDAVPDEVIEADLERYERMTVPVTIKNAGPFRFMIDTGAQATAVTRGMEQKLGLEAAGQAMLVGMASRAMVDLVDLDGLQLGTRTINNILAPLLERQHVGADGILGLDSLQDLRVLLDFRDNHIAVADADSLGGNRGYEIVVRARNRDGQLLITDAVIDGVRTAVIVDTGAQSTIGNMALRRKVRSRLEGETISTDVLGNQLMGNIGLIRRLEIEDLALNNLTVTYADTPAFDALGLSNRPALALGMRHLQMFDRVAIDFNSRRVLFDLPDGARRPALGEIFRTMH